VRTAACGLLNAIFPDDCRLCQQPLRNFSRIPVCDSCLARPDALVAEYFCITCKMPFLSPFPLDESGRCALCRMGLRGFDAVYSYGSYEGSLRELIHVFKYSKVRPLARHFGEWLAVALPREQSFDVVVPMPLHWYKRWQRGFNQSELLAQEISRRWNVPVRNLVRRKRATASQAGLTSAKRRANVQGAFSVPRGRRLDGLRVLLVDDVITTGATASACAQTLKRAGAKHVTVLALARADRRVAMDDLRVLKSAAAAAGSLPQ
jgi:ComF family protein